MPATSVRLISSGAGISTISPEGVTPSPGSMWMEVAVLPGATNRPCITPDATGLAQVGLAREEVILLAGEVTGRQEAPIEIQRAPPAVVDDHRGGALRSLRRLVKAHQVGLVQSLAEGLGSVRGEGDTLRSLC